LGSVAGAAIWAATVEVAASREQVQLTATDVRGNVSEPFPVTINLDTDVPQVAFSITGDLTETMKVVIGQVSDPTSGVEVVEVQVEENGVWLLPTTFDSADGSWLHLWETATAGETPRIRARATDLAGNQTISEWQSAVLSPPGGVENVSLWLRGNGGIRATSGAVSQWDDFSGLGHNATQATSVNQPLLVDNALNGLPVLRFDGTNDHLNLPSAAIEGANEFTFLIVFNRNGNSGPWQRLWEFGDGGDRRFSYVTPENGTGVPQFTLYDLDGATTEIRGAEAISSTGGQLLTLRWPVSGSGSLYTNGGETGTGPVYLSPATLGTINFHALGKAVGGFDNFNGDIAEVILYPTALSDAERTHVELYLRDKYDLDLTATGLYNDVMYSENVRGISQRAGVQNSADSGGLTIVDQTFLQDLQDLLLLGHNGSSGLVTDDVPAPVIRRTAREWRIVQVDSGVMGGTLRFTFDLPTLGIDETGLSAANFYLLTRSSNSRDAFTTVGTTNVTVNGTSVTFDANAADLNNLVTLGLDQEPNAITLESFTAAVTAAGSVDVRWTTSAEWNHAGYNVYRTATAQFEDHAALNTQMILSRGIQGQGADYAFEDVTATDGTWHYWLEDVDIFGTRTRHGPIELEITNPTAVAVRGAEATTYAVGRLITLHVALLGLTYLTMRARRRNRGGAPL
jgi:hypothetical protein